LANSIPQRKWYTELRNFPDGYKLSVARRDRQEVPHYDDQPDVRGGGTFVLLKDDIMAVRQTELETN
jgi:hypothetical protein